MKIKHKMLLALLLAAALISLNVVPASAAKYSASEAKKVRKFQKEYRKLNKSKYDKNNLYDSAPNFGVPFNAGSLNSKYISATMDYINYYRHLVGLPSEANYYSDNTNAQLGADALASVNASQDLKVHGLLGYTRPSYFPESDWNTAELSTLGNVNFLDSTSPTSAGAIVTDLLRENNNIAGKGNIGHRALLLSARATHMGVGAAYGSNNVLYSVENGWFADDILRTPVKKTVVYPAARVFPYELVGSKTPWSYSTAQRIVKTPKIYITDLTTKKKHHATQVHNFGVAHYGDGYATTITYSPGKTKLVNMHKYRVKIGKYYTYTFRFFRQNGKLK